MSGPELIVCPAVRGDWGVTKSLGGPPVPHETAPERAALVRLADGMLRQGMVLLDRHGDRALQLAQRCFYSALGWLRDVVDGHHPLTVYAWDRIGYTHHAGGNLEEAWNCYTISISLLNAGEWEPTIWNEMTFLNLMTLSGQLGRSHAQEWIREGLHEVQSITSGHPPGGPRTAVRREWTDDDYDARDEAPRDGGLWREGGPDA
jgi:hypothetical protein